MSNNKFMNIIFQTNQGEFYNMVFNWGETVNQMLIKFLKKIGRNDLIGNNSNSIVFLFNASQIYFYNQSTLKDFFQKSQSAKIYVNFSNQMSNNINNNSLNTHTRINSNDNSQYQKEIDNLKKLLKEEKDRNKVLKQENFNLVEKIETLNIEIAKLRSLFEEKEKNEKKKFKIENSVQSEYMVVAPGEKILAVNFVSMGVNDIGHYNLICKNTDLFVRVEERLYNDFPQFKDYETFYSINNKRIKRFKTLEDNKIKSNDVINIFINEE